MPVTRLTKTFVEKIPFSPGKQIFYFDTRLVGFGVRVSSYTKTYIVQCKVRNRRNDNGKPLQIKESIGKTEIVSFEKAYELAKAIIEDAAIGITPEDRLQEKKQQQERERAAARADKERDITLEDVFKAYCKTKKNLKKSTVDHYKLIMDAHIPDWLTMPVREITGSMVVERHALIGSTTEAVADTVMRVVRALINYAIDAYDDIVEKNPVRKLTLLNAWYKVERKTSYIKPMDLKAWFTAVLDLDNPGARDMIRLLVFTGARKEEAMSLQWKNVYLDEGICLFRETKSGNPLEIPLCKYVVEMLRERQKLFVFGPESFVFPSHGETGHLKKIVASCEAVTKASGVKFTPHDLRRTFISYCEILRIPPYTIKRLVNHALPKDVTEGYIQFHMNDLRRDVEKVASFILAKAGVKGKGVVVPIRKAS